MVLYSVGLCFAFFLGSLLFYYSGIQSAIYLSTSCRGSVVLCLMLSCGFLLLHRFRVGLVVDSSSLSHLRVEF